MLRTIKEQVKIKGSKRRYHNLVETKGSMKYQTNVNGCRELNGLSPD